MSHLLKTDKQISTVIVITFGEAKIDYIISLDSTIDKMTMKERRLKIDLFIFF